MSHHAFHISCSPMSSKLDQFTFRYISTQIENGIVNQDQIMISYVQTILPTDHQRLKQLLMNSWPGIFMVSKSFSNMYY